MAKANEQAAKLAAMTADPAEFRRYVYIETDHGRKFAAAVLEPFQTADFEAIDPACRRIAGLPPVPGQPIRGRAWLERPRGHSKTSDIALVVTWLLFATRRRITGAAAAGDEDQADLLRAAISRLVDLNPWLGDYIEVQRKCVIGKATGSRLDVLTSDAPTAMGRTDDFIVCDEIHVWGDRELWDSLFSESAKRAHCLLLVITNAGFIDSWQWEVRETVRDDPDRWHFSRLEGPKASWITPDRLAEQQRGLPRIAYERLWLNRWGAGSGDALDPEQINNAIKLDGPVVSAQPGWVYVAGLDLSTRKDKTALVVVGIDIGIANEKRADTTPTPKPVPRHVQIMRELGMVPPDSLTCIDQQQNPQSQWSIEGGSGRIKLAAVSLWQPQRGGTVDYNLLEAEIKAVHARLPISLLAYDPWNATMLSQRLAASGIPVNEVPFVGGNMVAMSQAMLDAFSQRQIDLYDHPDLITDLRGLRVSEKTYGVRLESKRTKSGHGDVATALALSLLAARRVHHFGAIATGEPLVCYP